MDFREAAGQTDLRTYIRVIERRKLTIILVTLGILGLALAYSVTKTPIYTASAQVLVPDVSAASALQPTSSQLQPAAASAQRSLTDAQQFAEGGQTRAAVRATLHYEPNVSVTPSTNADVLTFTASSTSKSQSAKAANVYAQTYISVNQANQVSQYAGQVLALQSSITKLQRMATSLPAGSEQSAAAKSSITSITQSLQVLQTTSELVAETGPTILNAAVPPTSQSSPKLYRNGALGLVFGLIFGLGLAFVRDRLDDKVRSLGDVEDNSGALPIVGIVPVVDTWRKSSTPHIAFTEDANSAVSEAYRTLRTSLQFLGIDANQQVIAITSATPDEGKSTASANLAMSFARAGQQVVVVSCDFRRPRLHQFFGLDNEVGATSVLLGQATLGEALQRVPHEPQLRVLTSGPVPPNPAEILSLDRVRLLIDALAKTAEIVLLDCPPVLPVTDSLLISRLCDSMIVIAVAGFTKKGDLRRTYELLTQVQAPVRGTILNRVPTGGAYTGGYGYGYGYGYSASERTNGSAAPVAKSPEPNPAEKLQPALSTTASNGHSERHGNGSTPSPAQAGRSAPPPSASADPLFDLRDQGFPAH